VSDKLLFVQVEYLLYELREPILLAACWLTLRTEMKAQMRPYVDVYVTLASVCDRFYEVIKDQRFRRIVKTALTGLLLLRACFDFGRVPNAEMKMDQWVMGYGSNGSPFLDGSRGSWVTASDPLTHDDETTAQYSLQFFWFLVDIKKLLTHSISPIFHSWGFRPTFNLRFLAIKSERVVQYHHAMPLLVLCIGS